MTYDVGQVIYVLSGETDKIVPMQISEELRRRTIDGEEVTYLIRSGPEKESFRLDQINGKVFTTLEHACEHLKKNFEVWLEKQIEWTVSSQRAWYKMSASEESSK